MLVQPPDPVCDTVKCCLVATLFYDNAVDMLCCARLNEQPSAWIGPYPCCRMNATCVLPCRRFQRSTKQLIPKQPFSRLVREVTASLMNESRWQRRAVEALQEAAEAYLVRLLQMFASERHVH